MQYAEVGAERAHGIAVLVRYDTGQLMQVSEIVDCPGG